MVYNGTMIRRGFALVEIVIGVAILASSILAFSLFYQKSLRVSQRTTTVIQSNFLLEEGVEAVKLMRDAGWQVYIESIATSTPYYFDFSGGVWSATTTNTYIDDQFERSFLLEDVFRDASDDISVSGTFDSGIRKATVAVSYAGEVGTTTKSVSIYLANIFSN